MAAILLSSIFVGSVVGLLWHGAYQLKFLGDVYINLMVCATVPLVFCSLSSSIANSNGKRGSRIFIVAITVFCVTAVISSFFMLFVMNCTYGFWSGGVLTNTYAACNEAINACDVITQTLTVSDFYLLLSKKSILQLMIAGVFLGIGIKLTDATAVRQLLNEMNTIMSHIVKLVSYFAPIGFIGLFSSVTASLDKSFLLQYGRLVLIYYGVSFVYVLTIYPLYVFCSGGFDALRVFLRYYWKSAINAFGTCSSAANIPVNLEIARLSGIKDAVSNIVIPLGSVVNMDGSSMSAVLKVLFLCDIFGKSFGAGELILVVIIATVSSVGMVSIPGGGGVGELILCSIFFNSSPEEFATAYALAFTIGNLIDPPATMVNSSGDYVVSFLVSRFVKDDSNQ